MVLLNRRIRVVIAHDLSGCDRCVYPCQSFKTQSTLYKMHPTLFGEDTAYKADSSAYGLSTVM